MNLDGLVHSIPETDAGLRANLARWVSDWKHSEGTVDELESLVGKWHGNVWFTDQSASDNFYRAWCVFKREAIDGILGLTMNERLYLFGLLDLWDQSDEPRRLMLRSKMQADA